MNKIIIRIILSIIILLIGSAFYTLFTEIHRGILQIWNLQEFLISAAQGLPPLLMVLLIGFIFLCFKKPFWGIGVIFILAFLLDMGARDGMNREISDFSANMGTLLMHGGVPTLIILLWSGKIGRL